MLTLISLLACVHHAPTLETPVERDLRRGFVDERAKVVIPVGPLASDEPQYRVFEDISTNGGFGADGAALELEVALRSPSSSQAIRGAVALPLARAAVAYGNPQLMQLACILQADVTDGPVRRTTHSNVVEDLCTRLVHAEPNETCSEAKELARSGWATLLQGNTLESRKQLAQALLAEARCPDGQSLNRTPVAPTAEGFVMVAILQLVEAPEQTFLSGEPTIPRFDLEVNESFKAVATRAFGGTP